jgi:ABC-type uncharacterized transport system YnjBCD substrate-binding protein
MRIVATAVLLTALAATPALAARTTSTSWEGVANEAQKQGPYSNVRGPDRSGTYVISNGRSVYRPYRQYRPYRGVWDY